MEHSALGLIYDAQGALGLGHQPQAQHVGLGPLAALQKLSSKQSRLDIPLAVLQQVEVQGLAMFGLQALAAQRGGSIQYPAAVVGHQHGNQLLILLPQAQKHLHSIGEQGRIGGWSHRGATVVVSVRTAVLDSRPVSTACSTRILCRACRVWGQMRLILSCRVAAVYRSAPPSPRVKALLVEPRATADQ